MNAAAADPLASGTHSVEIQGTTQRYHVHGSGPVLLAFSGGPGIQWDYLRMPAVEEHLTVVYVEPIGTGGSGRLPHHPHGYTRDRYTEFLDALIDHLAVPRVHLLGHSHGGFVTQHYALRHPDRLAGIILYESAAATGPEFGEEAMRKVAEFAERNAGRAELPGVLGAFQSIPAISNDEEFAATARGLLPAYFADYWAHEEERERFRATVGGSYISALDDDLTPDLIDDRGALAALRVPALVIVGRYDVICGVRWAEELEELIPDAELLVLEGSGHFGHIEEPERFAAAVAAFVAAKAA